MAADPELRADVTAWAEGPLAAATGRGERQPDFATPSGLAIAACYTPLDTDPAAYRARVGLPGLPPFTRGLRANGYRGRPWSIRQYAGFGTGAETSRRFRFLLDEGQTGLSLAFDLPTQMGLDSDDPRAHGEVGRLGAAVDTVDDLAACFDGVPLGEVSTSMTINAPAPVLVAMYVVVAEAQGVARDRIQGTVQNDVLKEYVARGTYIYPPRPSLRLAADLVAWCVRETPRLNPISLCGYHLREAGSTAVQEMAFALANALAYVDAVLAQGLAIDAFAPRLSWIFNTHSHLLEEVAKFRALRRMWAGLMRDRHRAQDPRSWELRTHTQTGGSTLTAQEPLTNIVRAAYQALAAVLGGVQSLALSCYDEALGIPSEAAQLLAVRTQQVLLEETGAADTADPLAGSYVVEALTDELERRAGDLLREVESLGGAVACIESGWMQRAIQEEAVRAEQALTSGRRRVVGRNVAVPAGGAAPPPVPGFRLDPALEAAQLERLRRARAGRDGGAARSQLDRLRDAAADPLAPLMPEVMEAVRRRCTVGEVCGVLAEVFGRYHAPAVI
ncbi:MAG TPA: methylmalonyl-CoA mutase family protein [Candidatus Micrarchaeia archaeon]|nr:methylmalonyl-CoA mutase family protein [Candidatus Micrarchaeia archaeon]